MIDDPILNFIIGVCIVATLSLAWISGKVDVASDCRKMGMTIIGGNVFECKEKEK